MQAGGRGVGRGMGQGRAQVRGAGPGGECVCPECGAKSAHQRGVPCFDVKCPKCGAAMTRRT
jgi:hypothetical protein